MAVISINRVFGAGGKTLGERVAKTLGYSFVDRDIIDWVADEAGCSRAWLEDVEKEPGRLLRILSHMVSGDYVTRHLSGISVDCPLEEYTSFVSKLIRDLLEIGNVVVLGRGGHLILPDNSGVIKVQLVADWGSRVEFLQERYNISTARAEELIAREEDQRAVFLAHLTDGDPGDPALFHLTINTRLVSLDKAEKAIIGLLP